MGLPLTGRGGLSAVWFAGTKHLAALKPVGKASALHFQLKPDPQNIPLEIAMPRDGSQRQSILSGNTETRYVFAIALAVQVNRESP